MPVLGAAKSGLAIEAEQLFDPERAWSTE